VFAGSVAGTLAILFEKKQNRTGIAQQLFVRCVEIWQRCIETEI
jgi:hypothetical protein